MTIDKQKLRKDADTIFGNGPGLLMAIPAADVRGLLAEIERIELISRISCNHDGFKAVLDERDQLKAENEALRKDVERYNWAICRVQCAEALSAVVICHDGYKEKINERVDAYMDAWPCPVAALAKEASHD